MLALIDRFKYQHKKIVVFKPKMDDRYDQTAVVTHGGWSIPAIAVENGPQILKYLADLEEHPDVVAIDEMFMIPGSAKVLIWLYRTGIDVVVSSLDLTATCKPFEEVKQLLPWATRIKKCTAVCVVCGKDAAFSYRKSDDTDDIIIGGAEKYEPRCAVCHPLFRVDD